MITARVWSAVGQSAAIAGALAMSQSAMAAPGQEQSATGIAVAEIVTPLRVTSITDLDFGGIALQSTGAGSVTVDPAGDAPEYNGVRQISCGGSSCPPQPAQFGIKGMGGRNYRVVLPETALANPVAGNATALQVIALHSASVNLPGSSNRGLLDASGDDLIKVGGTLEVPAGTAPGRYVAQLLLVVSYD